MTTRKTRDDMQIEPPFRSELWSADKISQYGETLAQAHSLVHKRKRAFLLARLIDNEIQLTKIYEQLNNLPLEASSQSPIAEWLLDNFHLIHGQIQTVKNELPKSYGKNLPQLATGPRSYNIVLQFLAHTDSQWHLDTLKQFIANYQTVHVLTLGELWSIPIMFRLALIENLRRLSSTISCTPHAEKIQAAALNQALTLLSFKHSIESLRHLTEIDWREFVESASVVERILRQDPSGEYSTMDFDTRNRYRRVVESLALASRKNETEIANAAIQLSQQSRLHVGYYLIGKHLRQLQQTVGARLRLFKKFRRWFLQNPLPIYLGLIGVVTFSSTAMLLSRTSTTVSTFSLLLFGVALALTTSQLAVSLVNWLFMLFIQPVSLPRMDFSRQIPTAWRTIVVVPVILADTAIEIDEMVKSLEVHFLGNRDESLQFALLSDFKDADQECCPGEDQLLAYAEQAINILNQRYPRENADIFYLLHRSRRWNAQQQIWMGYERKPGKLHDLNALLLRGDQTPFSPIVGRISGLTGIKTVITLDSNTQLPRGTARKLIAAMAHPLNRPVYDANLQRVVEGYGILQPRIDELMPYSKQTRYTRLYSFEIGIDPYTRLVSDLYQAVFDEGSFMGKGIYDLEVFDQVLGQRFPENRILSHDLLEGCYLRSALLPAVPLYESPPNNYLADATRRTRWIRGDWQLLAWLGPRVLDGTGQTIKNTLTGLSRWKLFDNLRRSLTTLSLLLLFFLTWTILPHPNVWFSVILSIIVLPTLLNSLWEFIRKPRDISFAQHLIVIARSTGWRLTQVLWHLVSLPYDAWYSLAAIARTIWRMTVTHRNLLEWTPSATADRAVKNSPRYWLKTMWAGPAVAVITSACTQVEAFAVASPLLALWFASPWIAWWLSQPIARATPKLSAEQNKFLHSTARQTWSFFETFVTAGDHWLPPDNYQESPIEHLAHRTSPTNMGLYLLANLTAYDFGYISCDQLLERTQQTLNSMERLERYQGHFYNWYNTETLQPLFPRFVSTVDSGNLAGHLLILRQGLLELATTKLTLIETLAAQAFNLATNMNFNFLCDPRRPLLSIGYHVEENKWDPNHYELLSSEARLTIFVAIALGQLQEKHWYALGRSQTVLQGKPILLSWCGSMFEYLMPLLIMPTFEKTLLDQTCHHAVSAQINYGDLRAVPWGISESGMNALYANQQYRYGPFGVPELGLKPGLADDLVIAPYATMMALMIAPEAACENLHRLVEIGGLGRYGFIEAIDFTPSRLIPDQTHALVKSFMTHHQGMSFLALSYLLNQQPMQRRFLAEPLFQSTLMLLQERIPKPVAAYTPGMVTAAASTKALKNAPLIRSDVQLLSNGRYHLMMTNMGSGVSRWQDLAVTRWRPDSTYDHWGLFAFLREMSTGAVWSTCFQPFTDSMGEFTVDFSEGHAIFTRDHVEISVHSEIVIAPEEDLEIRRYRIENHASDTRTLEFTSYAEVLLAPLAADEDHPAFSNLFVNTEIFPEHHAILATRRSESDQDRSPWMLHQLIVSKEKSGQFSFETDRAQFIGRGQTIASARAMMQSGSLSNTAGAVLDPMVAIRCQIRVEPNTPITLVLITGVAENRQACVALLEKYHEPHRVDRVFELALASNHVLLSLLNISERDAQLFQKLAHSIIYVNPQLRAEPTIIASNKKGQSGLWAYSISGDLPIVLLRFFSGNDHLLLQQLINAQIYLSHKGWIFDLVIIYEGDAPHLDLTDRSGGIFLRSAAEVAAEDFTLLQAVARVNLSNQNGTLAEQLDRRSMRMPLIPLEPMVAKPQSMIIPSSVLSSEPLQYFNGVGGYAENGREYVIQLSEDNNTPTPWINVLANPNFGTFISESGQSCTWFLNSHEFRLTPWNNDPLQDLSGEHFYCRDEETAQFWSPTPLPCRGRGDYEIRHGFGYSVLSHREEEIYSELWSYVAKEAAVKFTQITLRNESKRSRKISLTGYVEWVLGDVRSKTTMHIITESSDSGALFARNPYHPEFHENTAFFNAKTNTAALRTVTGDRLEFLGQHGSYRQPAALKRTHLSGRLGAGLDPCAAIQLVFDLAAGEHITIVYTLGAAADKIAAEKLDQQFQDLSAAKQALSETQHYWQRSLSTVQIKTPDSSFDYLANGWLLYQVLSSRYWGRTAYYQSSGAFGFRDQLQDVMALVHAEPMLYREHLLRCAAHQFVEGDVQHWWHPPSNHGLRTRCSDDFLWLPFALCRYVDCTGDLAILEEKVTFLTGRPLKPNEASYYDVATNGETDTLYQHGVRAILHGLQYGSHGLPLMGAGDWNDGMNRVGEQGKGESIWLGFFLFIVLKKFATLAHQHGDTAFADRCRTESLSLQQAIETHGWDGDWYRRAYFDDGTVLGSVTNSECQIDSIAQSWAVLSGAANPERAAQAMSALHQRLVKTEGGLIELLTPPFDHSKPSPGYIQAYLPGIRENGGQYTHAAMWTIMAFAALGKTELAWSLFQLINPIHHGGSAAAIAVYKIEPYVLAGDVYSVSPHVGRGGWSWYTGSAGWMYQLMIESLLGIRLQAQHLILKPTLPEGWNTILVEYRFGKTLYQITIQRSDGIAASSSTIPLIDDGKTHQIIFDII